MKTKNKKYSGEQEMLFPQISQEDSFLVSFLSGFDRKKMKEWANKGLFGIYESYNTQ